MSFPWLTVTAAPGGAARRVAIVQAELRDRAALLARLGFTPAAKGRPMSNTIYLGLFMGFYFGS